MDHEAKPVNGRTDHRDPAAAGARTPPADVAASMGSAVDFLRMAGEARRAGGLRRKVAEGIGGREHEVQDYSSAEDLPRGRFALGENRHLGIIAVQTLRSQNVSFQPCQPVPIR
jgi:hypothetical protein